MSKVQSTIKALMVWTTVLCITVQSFGRGPAAVLCFGGYLGSISAGCGDFVPESDAVETDACCGHGSHDASSSDANRNTRDCSLCIVVDADQRLGEAPHSCDFKPCFAGCVPDFAISAGIVMPQNQASVSGWHVPVPRDRGFAARSSVRLI